MSDYPQLFHEYGMYISLINELQGSDVVTLCAKYYLRWYWVKKCGKLYMDSKSNDQQAYNYFKEQMDIVDRIKSANPIFGQQEGRNQFLKFIAQKRSEVKQNESSHQYEEAIANLRKLIYYLDVAILFDDGNKKSLVDLRVSYKKRIIDLSKCIQNGTSLPPLITSSVIAPKAPQAPQTQQVGGGSFAPSPVGNMFPPQAPESRAGDYQFPPQAPESRFNDYQNPPQAPESRAGDYQFPPQAPGSRFNDYQNPPQAPGSPRLNDYQNPPIPQLPTVTPFSYNSNSATNVASNYDQPTNQPNASMPFNQNYFDITQSSIPMKPGEPFQNASPLNYNLSSPPLPPMPAQLGSNRPSSGINPVMPSDSGDQIGRNDFPMNHMAPPRNWEPSSNAAFTSDQQSSGDSFGNFHVNRQEDNVSMPVEYHNQSEPSSLLTGTMRREASVGPTVTEWENNVEEMLNCYNAEAERMASSNPKVAKAIYEAMINACQRDRRFAPYIGQFEQCIKNLKL